MQARLLKGKTGEELLIFFAGWGFDERPFLSFAARSPFDVMVIFDYRELDLPPWPEDYRRYQVLGWSLGGLVALKFERYLPGPLFLLATTGHFCHETLGIPPKIYGLTLSGLRRFGQKSLAKFYAKMFQEEEDLVKFLKNPPSRALEEVILELEFASTYTAERPSGPVKVIITTQDRIIPPKAQLNFWQGQKVKELPWGHFPFYRFKDFSALLAAF